MRQGVRRPAGERAAGFTLLEVVLATGLLLLGLTAILGLFSFGAASSRASLLEAEAAAAVDAVVAELEATLFPLRADGSAGPPVVVEDRPVPGHPGLAYGCRTTPNPALVAADGLPVEYRVDVDVSWSSRGARRAVTFSTLMLREVPFGERMRRRFVAGDVPDAEEARASEPTSRP